MKKITLGHGSGGRLMHDLIKGLFLKHLGNPFLERLGDGASVRLISPRCVYTTDSFVVKPLFFPGGDIGKLCITGTINDLVVCGARPRYLSCSMIVEDGFDYDDLQKIVLSIKAESRANRVYVVTGDFKVVEKGAGDKIFINTSGIGEMMEGASISMQRIRPGDKILINGPIAEHALALVVARGDLKFKVPISSDCASLMNLISSVISKDIKFMRDPTRGGIATTLNEIAEASGYNIEIKESDIPIRKDVQEFCNILGFDPLYLANEGKVIMVVSRSAAEKVLAKMRKHLLGRKSAIIGEIREEKDGKVYLKTYSGGRRILDMLTGEQLPRIC